MLKFIPRGIIHAAARETGVNTKARSYSVLSQLGTMLFVQLAHALSLNDGCDWLRLKARAIAAFDLTPPSRLSWGSIRLILRASAPKSQRAPPHFRHISNR